jgi:hypothetical protein
MSIDRIHSRFVIRTDALLEEKSFQEISFSDGFEPTMTVNDIDPIDKLSEFLVRH